MARLVWGEPGTRIYETGVDRGVLYPPNGAVGVPWNGLVSVKETPNGGEPQAYYLDGVKYFQIASAEEFKGTIQAFSAPPEFALCDGVATLYAGLSITQQPRKLFGFAYRTLVGNDTAAESYGYKLHLVYNALARPAQRDRSTLSDTAEPMDLSWDIETVPPAMSGVKPSAHLVISSLEADPAHLIAVENILYGIDGGSFPRMPTISELLTIFSGSESDTVWTDIGDGTYTGVGDDLTDNGDGTFSAANVTDNGNGTFTT
jgi:hypothetical protein